MKGKGRITYLFVCLLNALSVMISCDVQDQWLLDVPEFDGNSEIANAPSVSEQTAYALEGIYRVIQAADLLGDTIVPKHTGDRISLFGLKGGFYSILKSGVVGNSIILEGYWRYAQNDRTGLLRLKIENAANLLNGDTIFSDIDFTGKYGETNNIPVNEAEIVLLSKLTQKIRSDKFIIGAHRGGGRTSDNLPVSENSVAMINYTEYLGSTGIEVDVVLTKDKIPVLYHDDDLNIRLIQKGPLYGSIQDYKLSQLRTLVKLIHGEDIPTLEEALDAVIQNTKLRLVWLDIKDAESLNTVIPMQQKYLDKAKKQGRELEILVGIPSDDIFNSLKTIKDYNDIPTLCELTTDKVTDINSRAWAFRWTMGLQEAEVAKMHSQNRKCLVWTLDGPGFMEIYTVQGKSDPSKRFDGILTNYPTILAYYFYVRYN
jgi:glycerophosphoryl diester phosphodiesterase